LSIFLFVAHCFQSCFTDDWFSDTFPSLWRHCVSVCRREN